MDYSCVYAWTVTELPCFPFFPFFPIKPICINSTFCPSTTLSETCKEKTLLMGCERLKLAYLKDYNLYFSIYCTIFRWLIPIHFLNHAEQNSFNNNLWPVERVTSFPWCLKKHLQCQPVRDAGAPASTPAWSRWSRTTMHMAEQHQSPCSDPAPAHTQS